MTRDEAEALRNDDRYWTLGIVYACREDPRVIVRSRRLLGWSWNFGHPLVAPALVAFVLIAIGPITLLQVSGVTNGRVLIAVAVVCVGLLVAIARHIAAGPR